MATVLNFEELEIWQLARQQAIEIFRLYSIEPFSKDWELRNQINAASGSVMDNIAEGFERSGNKEFTNFLLISKGSNGEVRSQLYRAHDRNYITIEKFRRNKI
jgi:four helix bundle protein